MSTPTFPSFPATPSTIDVGVPPSTPFSVKDSVVLITGGGSGLGLSFTELFIKAGAKTVIITGRRENVLKEAQTKYPDHIVYYVSDAGSADDRVKLFQKVSKDYPNLNILLNNAGIQNRVPLSSDNREWKETAEEIEINLSAPIHYSQLFTPLLLSQKKESAIIHVTSGLAFVAFPPAPLYSATKFGLHSFILSQRYSFQGTTVRIVEFVPPATRSNLGGSHAFGEDCDEVCKSMFDRFIGGELEIGYKFSEIARTTTRDKQHNMMVGIAKVMHVQPFKQ